jgi:DNA-binding response OmpR family regulator
LRITIVEDNDSVARGISYRLQDVGHAVDLIADGDHADACLRGDWGDLLILDVTLPGLDGLSVLRRLRARGDVRPVILLTALSDTCDRVAGLDAGADDYLVKPFEMAELEARVRALNRRSERPIRAELSFGPLRLDTTARIVSAGGIALDLPRRELALLESLIGAQGRIVSRNDLISNVYGTGADVEDSAVEAHISRLRKRLKPHGCSIRVRRGIGYQLEDTATETPEPPSPEVASPHGMDRNAE